MEKRIKTYLWLLGQSVRTEHDEALCSPPPETHIDWHDLLQFAFYRSVAGVYWLGITNIFESENNPYKNILNKPTDDDVMEWLEVVNETKRRNLDHYKRTAFVFETFKKEGFRCCILKGQSNAVLYPDPFIRATGDIDLWLDASREDAVNYVRKIFPKSHDSNRHHIDFPIFQSIGVEVHYYPSYMRNPIHNRRLRQYFGKVRREQMTNLVTLPIGKPIAIPIPELNVIFQLCHVMQHFIAQGIGFKQLVDYHYVLKTYYEWRGNHPEAEDITKLLKRFGLYKFSRTMMYIMQEATGLDEKYLITPPDEKRGAVVLESIVIDEHSQTGEIKNILDLNNYTLFQRQFLKTIRTIRLSLYFPGESLWGLCIRIKDAIIQIFHH